MKRSLLLITVLGTFYSSFAQKTSDNILHTVEAKETLYSLVKKYNTNFATVETLNPSLSGGKVDIKIGQIIKFQQKFCFFSVAKSQYFLQVLSQMYI